MNHLILQSPLFIDGNNSANAAKLTDGWTPILPVPADAPPETPSHRLGAPRAKWTYRDGAGNELGHILRFDLPDGTKEFYPLTYCEHTHGRREWRWKSFDAPRPLYGLDQLERAPEAPVLLTEGEKAADAARLIFPHHVVVTSPGGSHGALKADWSPLIGRGVTIWPDADEPGQAYARDAAQCALQAGAASVRLTELPNGLPKGWDLADPLPDGFGSFDLHAALTDALPLEAMHADNPKRRSHVELISAADIKPEAIRWIWEGYLARAKLHILAGAPGTGKTTLAISLAATITNGALWPDGTRCEPGHVVIWSGEDDPKDTLAPRLLACGAKLESVSFVQGWRDDYGARSFDPSTDMDELTQALTSIPDVRLLIIDSIVSAVSGDSHKNAEVRRGLQPLVDLGTNLDCAILGITHFSKGSAGRAPTERVTGSLAFGAVARMVFAVAKREEDAEGGSRLFVRTKSNIAPDTGGFAYDLEQVTLEDHPEIETSRVRWGAYLDGEAKELLAQAENDDPDDLEERRAGYEWLQDRLANGPVAKRDLDREAKQQGISPKSLRTLKRKLSVTARKDGYEGGWMWELPSIEDAPSRSGTTEGAQDARIQCAGPLGTFDDMNAKTDLSR
tara:strand:- start:3649 stop:5511 length:1863 start_codon:yes stop_codon:yes gene_type:complete